MIDERLQSISIRRMQYLIRNTNSMHHRYLGIHQQLARSANYGHLYLTLHLWYHPWLGSCLETADVACEAANP